MPFTDHFTRLAKACFLLLLCSFFFPAPDSHSAQISRSLEGETPFTVSADEIVWDKKDNTIIAKGSVRFRFGDLFLEADIIKYQIENGDIQAQGNAEFEYEDSLIFADHIEYNINTNLAIMYNTEGHIGGRYIISAEKMKKIGENRYSFERGTFTTCLCDNPAWFLTLKKGTLKIEDYAVLRGVGLRIKGFPVAVLPVAILPVKTERKTGFLLSTLGVSNLDGFTVRNKFFWAINEQSDATMGVDYLNRRGWSPNLEFRYIISERSRGNIYGSILKDRSTDTLFYEIRGGHSQLFRYDIYSELKIDLESAVSFARNFELDVEQRAKVRTDSYLYTRKNWKLRAIQIENRFFKSSSEPDRPSFALLPKITFVNLSERLHRTPFYYDFAVNFTNFVEELPGDGNRYQSRLDFFPRLTLPIHSSSWWNFSQSIGFRETLYIHQKNVDKPINRELFIAQSILEAPRLYRTFNLRLGSIDRMVHIVEPVINYTYISDNDRELEGRINIFDEIDELKASSFLSYGFVNRFIAREVGAGGQKRVREVGRITFSQRYDIVQNRNGGPNKEPFSELLIDVKTWLLPALRITFDGLYSFEEDSLETINFAVDYKIFDSINFVFDSRLKRGRLPSGSPKTDYIRAGVGVDIGKEWYIEYAARVNLLRTSGIAENSVIVKYSSQCWSGTARLVNRFDETTVDFQVEFFGLGGLGEKIGRTVYPEIHPGLWKRR